MRHFLTHADRDEFQDVMDSFNGLATSEQPKTSLVAHTLLAGVSPDDIRGKTHHQVTALYDDALGLSFAPDTSLLIRKHERLLVRAVLLTKVISIKDGGSGQQRIITSGSEIDEYIRTTFPITLPKSLDNYVQGLEFDELKDLFPRGSPVEFQIPSQNGFEDHSGIILRHQKAKPPSAVIKYSGKPNGRTIPPMNIVRVTEDTADAATRDAEVA